MILDWDTLNRWAIIFGIVTGIGAICSWIYWAVKRSRPQSKQNPGVEFDIKEQHMGLERGGITFARQELRLEEEFIVELVARVFISNPGPSTSVAFYVVAIEPDCLQDGTLAKALKVTIQHQIDPHHSPTPQDNPLYLKSEEMNSSILIRTKIPFSLSKIESKLGSLYSLKSISVTLGAEQTGRKPILRSKSCDLVEIHHNIEEEVATKIQHIQNFQLSAKQVLQVLKRYWQGPG